MSLLNLSLLQFLGLFAVGSAVLIALYLLDRTRRRRTVPTLQFFQTALKPAQVRRRSRIREPWSLALQMLALLLLLLAIARPQIGGAGRRPADHVLLVDASAWMAATTGGETLMQQARVAAQRYVRALPPLDRVMLVKAGAVPAPIASFEADRQKLEEAIQSIEPGATSVNLERAFAFAQSAMSQARRKGEIAFVTGGRVSGDADVGLTGEANLRVIQIQAPLDNIGLRRIGLRNPPERPDVWEAFISARNDGTRSRDVTLGISFAGAPAGANRVRLDPGQEQESTIQFRAPTAGWLEVRLLPQDSFPQDNYARIEIPERKRVRVAVFSDSPAKWRAFFASSPIIDAQFLAPTQYGSQEADVFLLDRFLPKGEPPRNAVFVQPPPDSPVPVQRTVESAELRQWTAGHPLTVGLVGGDLRFGGARIFSPKPDQQVVGRADQGPLVVADPQARQVFIGFDPASSALRYDLTAPLLLANILRWMHPDLFRQWELTAGSAGFVTATIPEGAGPVEVRGERGQELPFTRSGDTVRFFTPEQGIFQVDSDLQRRVYSLSLPEAGDTVWIPPATAKRGVPPRAAIASSRDIWWLLVLLAGGCLALEWFLYGRKADGQLVPVPAAVAGAAVPPVAAPAERRAS